MPTLHVELTSSKVALLPLFVSEVVEELQTLGILVGDFDGFKANSKATYKLRRGTLKDCAL